MNRKDDLVIGIKEILSKHNGISSGDMDLACEIYCESIAGGRGVSTISFYDTNGVTCDFYYNDREIGCYRLPYGDIEELVLEEIFETLTQYNESN